MQIIFASKLKYKQWVLATVESEAMKFVNDRTVSTIGCTLHIESSRPPVRFLSGLPKCRYKEYGHPCLILALEYGCCCSPRQGASWYYQSVRAWQAYPKPLQACSPHGSVWRNFIHLCCMDTARLHDGGQNDGSIKLLQATSTFPTAIMFIVI